MGRGSRERKRVPARGTRAVEPGVGGARESPAASGTGRDGAGLGGAGRPRSRRARTPSAGPRRLGLPGGSRRRARLLGAVGLLLGFGVSFCLVGGFFRCFRLAFALLPARRCAEVGLEVQKKKRKNPVRPPRGRGRAAGAWEAARAPCSCLRLPGRQGLPASEGPCSGRDPLPQVGRSLAYRWKAQG